MAGNAIRGAAEEAEKRWLEGDRRPGRRLPLPPRPTVALDPETGAGDGNITFGYVAQAVDVSVDLETGHVTVHEVVNASDVGRAINPDWSTRQVHGAVVQAHGYTITEDLQVAGRPDRQPAPVHLPDPGDPRHPRRVVPRDRWRTPIPRGRGGRGGWPRCR